MIDKRVNILAILLNYRYDKHLKFTIKAKQNMYYVI